MDRDPFDRTVVAIFSIAVYSLITWASYAILTRNNEHPMPVERLACLLLALLLAGLIFVFCRWVLRKIGF